MGLSTAFVNSVIPLIATQIPAKVRNAMCSNNLNLLLLHCISMLHSLNGSNRRIYCWCPCIDNNIAHTPGFLLQICCLTLELDYEVDLESSVSTLV